MSKSILIAEDEKAIAEALKLKLERSGFEVVIARDGKEALELTKNKNFDLIILDLIMPNLDGFEFLAAAKKQGIASPIIVASNLGQPEDEKKAKELGAKDFFIKSNVSVAEVAKKVKEALL